MELVLAMCVHINWQPVSFSPKQYYVSASLKLQLLLQMSSVPKQDVFFALAHLARILNEAVENGELLYLE